MFSASHLKSRRAIAWLLVSSSLACWEIAAARFQGCSLGSPDLRACQPVDMSAPDQAVLVLQHKTGYHQSAQLIGLTSSAPDLFAEKPAYSEADPTPYWLSHLDAPPTPPPKFA